MRLGLLALEKFSFGPMLLSGRTNTLNTGGSAMRTIPTVVAVAFAVCTMYFPVQAQEKRLPVSAQNREKLEQLVGEQLRKNEQESSSKKITTLRLYIRQGFYMPTPVSRAELEEYAAQGNQEAREKLRILQKYGKLSIKIANGYVEIDPGIRGKEMQYRTIEIIDLERDAKLLEHLKEINYAEATVKIRVPDPYEEHVYLTKTVSVASLEESARILEKLDRQTEIKASVQKLVEKMHKAKEKIKQPKGQMI